MNCKQHLLSLGLDKAILVMKENGCKNLGEYIEKISGLKPSGYGLMNGGILLDSDTWDQLESIDYTESRSRENGGKRNE